jgi:glycerol-3-phosphate dehydrogenase (NAD(P)+)
MDVTIVGAGSWGTAVAWLLASKGVPVRLWGRTAEIVEGIARTGRNPRYLPELELPETVEPEVDLSRAVDGADVVVVATPSHGVRATAEGFAPHLDDATVLVSLAKGLERETLMRMTEVLADVAGVPSRIAALSGPNHAEEVSLGVPTTTVIAAYDHDVGCTLRDLFTTDTFRAYTNDDVVGVELCGASKNVIAVATGMADGLGYGDNTKAALMTRGLAEMTRLGRHAGANALTFMGLAGMGDLIATCTSRHSRNRAFGELVAKGGTLEDFTKETHMVAEGARSCVTVHELGDRLGCDLPITAEVRGILYEGRSTKEAVGSLMGRTATDELHGLGLVDEEGSS